MLKMKVFVLIISTFSLLLTQTTAQKFREVHLNISSKMDYSIIQQGFTLEDQLLLFALKYCGNGIALVHFFDHAGQLLYYVALHAHETSVAVEEVGGPYQKQFILPEYVLTCNTFGHYRLGWKNGYFALWRKHNSMWNPLLNWQDPTPNVDSIADVQITFRGTFEGELKIYIIEHSTVAFRTTCGKF